MRQLSEEYLAAAKAAGRYPNVKILLGEDTEISGNSEIIELHIMAGDSAKPAAFDPARALSSECRITVDRRRMQDETEIKSGTQIQVYAAFNNAAGAEVASVIIGTYYITSYDKSDKILGIITASDIMLYAGVDFNPTLIQEWPCSLTALAREAFRQAGITVDNDFALDVNPYLDTPPYKSDEPIAEGMQGNPYTCREVIARAAGMNLGACFISADGTPKLFGYGAVNTTAITDDMVVEARIGSESYYISLIKVYKSEERMAKDDAGYRELPYAPRFEDMGNIKEDTAWKQQIATKGGPLANKPWTTATVTIKGVGEIELGDFVQAVGETLLISGIAYDFAGASFNETLYSFAYTEEEYYMAPQSTVSVTTGTGKNNVPAEYAQPTDPALDSEKTIKTGDKWYKTDNATNKNIVAAYKRTKAGSWGDMYNVSGGGGSGGVGENLAPYSATAERFNDYSEITYDSSGFTGGSVSTVPYDHIEGLRNYSTGSGSVSGGAVVGAGANHISGQQNKADSALECTISGSHNTVKSSQDCSVSGDHNTIQNSQDCDVSGNNNTISGAKYSSIGNGQLNKIEGGLHNFCIGQSNTEKSCNYTDMGGSSNTAQNCSNTIIRGHSNSVTGANDSAILSNNATVIGTITNILSLGGGTISGEISNSIFVQSTGGEANGTIYGCISIGDFNKLYGRCRSTAVFGGNNTVTEADYGSFVAGANNTLTGRQGIVLGNGGIIDSDNPYVFAVGRSAGSGNGFAMDAYGNVYAAGAYNTMGADYAEYFEWAEKSEENKTRRGYLVEFCGDKIIPAHGDDFIGVISVNPSIVGNACELHWHGKYLLDEFGKLILDKAEKPIISPEYDPKQKYIPRSQRPEEWAAVGLLGRMVIVDDGSCKPGGFVSARYGIGTKCYAKTNAKVLRRINENHCEVLVGR